MYYLEFPEGDRSLDFYNLTRATEFIHLLKNIDWKKVRI